jgi:2-polyprenyl-6-methoxyphenol hydroxylase-like FAD-dependent oxidoreductase
MSLPTRCRFLAFMPQWDFLEIIRSHAARYPTFQLRMRSEAVDLIESDGRILGVQVRGPGGMFAVRADLTVCADGRRSLTRGWAGLKVKNIGTPADVLWMRISRRPGDGEPIRRIASGEIFVTIDRGDYWQCALVILKDSFSEIRQKGLPAFRGRIVRLMPVLQERVSELASWDDIKLLSVTINRLQKWYRPGLLCIGDAAHAMSPVIGVGINLAIQDAVAAANILAQPLRHGNMSVGHLRQVQRRRKLPACLMHWLQIFVDRRIVGPAIATRRSPSIPWTLRLLRRFPVLRRMVARVIGLGFRSEHVLTPDMSRVSNG